MNIIIKKQDNTRIIDGINTILNLDDITFNKVIEKLSTKNKYLENIEFYYTSDECENPSANIQLGLEKNYDENGNFISRAYFGGERKSISEIFKILAEKQKELKEDSQEYIRISELLKTRNLDSVKTMFLDDDGENIELLDKVIEIVTNDEINQKFLDYNNNRDYFSIKGQSVEIGEYLKYLGKIFGNKNKLGQLSDQNSISKDFYIPELAECKTRYLEIFDKINIDRYVNPTYEFRRFTTLNRISNTVIRKDEEPDWTINPELSDLIMQDMARDLSLEEQAMHIYGKMCKELSYDEGYLFREHLNNEKYEHTFSKEHLESIKPGSKVTCWDFARIFSKIVNGLEGDIEAVVISEGLNQGHYLAGFYTDKVSVMLEAINGRTGGTNDLMKAKNGIKFEGIEIVSDRDGIIEKTIKKVYPQIFKEPQTSIEDYLQELKELPKEEIPNNFELKLQSFIEIMKQNNIYGNEAVQTFLMYEHSGFFGEALDKSYLGKEEYKGEDKTYRRMVLIRTKNEYKEKLENCCLYLIDSDSLELSTCTAQEIINKLKTGEFIYESEKHKMAGIDMEEK